MPRGNENLLETLPPEDVTSIAKIIVSLSVQFAERFPFLVIDDCIQVAWRELVQYQSYYDTDKSKVTSWVYGLVRDTFTSYAQKEYNKTQKSDDIDNYTFPDQKVTRADIEYAYQDFLDNLRNVLSPKCYQLLMQLEKNPKVCLSDLVSELELSERDLVYLRDELRVTTRHIMEV